MQKVLELLDYFRLIDDTVIKLFTVTTLSSLLLVYKTSLASVFVQVPRLCGSSPGVVARSVQ